MTSTDASGPGFLITDPRDASAIDGAADENENPAPAVAATPLDIRQLFQAHYASVWRLLRRLGVSHDQLDDASQEVFWIAARRLETIRAGSESAFLYGVALRVASDLKRRRRAQPWSGSQPEVEDLVTELANPEDRLEQRRGQKILACVLDQLPLELRTVFVAFELEGWRLEEIAELEGLPLGTVSSRLRRAREEFSAASRRFRAALAHRGGR